MGSTMASSTSCVPRSERTKRPTRRDGLKSLANTSLTSTSAIDHGLRELRVNGAAARLIATLAEHQTLADVLGLPVAAGAALHLRLKEEGGELVEGDGVAAGVELVDVHHRDEHYAPHRQARVVGGFPVGRARRRVAILLPRDALL